MGAQSYVDRLIIREAGFVDNRADRGGPTKFGVTQSRLAKHRGRDVSVEEVRNLSVTEARYIHTIDLQNAGLDQLAATEVVEVMVDCVANHGQDRAVRLLQRAIGSVNVDGVLGPITAGAANGMNGLRLALSLCSERVAFYGRLISGSLEDKDGDGIPDNTEFAAGWLNRTALLQKQLLDAFPSVTAAAVSSPQTQGGEL